eukprot:Colp12_sorted_trinity150504_noHs@34978
MLHYNVRPEVAVLENEMISHRRHLHQHPELKYEEHATANFVAERLLQYGYEVQTGIAVTGVVGVLRGKHSGPCIAIRADMDGLPITETTGLPFGSQNKGVMHACGHDGHVTILLAAAKVFSTWPKDEIHGSIKLLFQPAEEGGNGASAMIDEGVLEGVDQIYGLHLWNYTALGQVTAKMGPLMAACDTFEIHAKGRGGHGAVPQGTVDAVVLAANLVLALQTIVSRNIDPLEPAVVTIGQINAGYSNNIIADSARLTGTIRSFGDGVQDLIVKRIEEICKSVADTYGGEAKFSFASARFPATVNTSKVQKMKSLNSRGKKNGEWRKEYFFSQICGFLCYLCDNLLYAEGTSLKDIVLLCVNRDACCYGCLRVH